MQGHPGRYEVHRRPVDAFHAGGDAVAQPEVARVPEHGQQDRHILGVESIQDEPEEDLHGAHGRRIRVRLGFLAGYEVRYMFGETEGSGENCVMRRVHGRSLYLPRLL